MSTYARALEFAARKHAGHKRNNGDNYIIHPIRVSQEVFSEKQKQMAQYQTTQYVNTAVLQTSRLNTPRRGNMIV